MNTKAKGEKAQIIVMGEFAKFDIPVLVPLSDNLRFDFVIVVDGQFRRIQVKSSEKKNTSGAVEFSLITSNWYQGTITKYTKDDCDLMVCYAHETNDFYILGPDSFADRRSFSVRKDKPRNGQSKGINFHDDFVLTKARLEKLLE